MIFNTKLNVYAGNVVKILDVEKFDLQEVRDMGVWLYLFIVLKECHCMFESFLLLCIKLYDLPTQGVTMDHYHATDNTKLLIYVRNGNCKL